ncbi:MAG: regulatory protein RecX [Candidatus Omnitrophica bacterium]|nr:regulatory protein RecX [Candidatus Omnitrophota bacterium]
MDIEKYILNFIKIRPRSKKEVSQRLIDKGVSKDEIQKILDAYEKKGFLGDDGFTKWWIEQRLLSYKARLLIEQELLQKGIDLDLIEKNMDLMDVDDKKTIKRFAKDHFDNNCKDLEKEKIKIYRKLLSKGFAAQDIEEFFDIKEIS